MNDRPHDAAWFMDQFVIYGGFIGALVVMVAVGATVFRSPERAATMPAAVPEIPFRSPLGCDATMTVQVGPVHTQPPFCYVRGTPQVWL